MPTPTPHVSDFGNGITVTCYRTTSTGRSIIDLTGVDVITITVKRSDGSIESLDGSVLNMPGTDGKIRGVPAEDFYNDDGKYQAQALLIWGTAENPTERIRSNWIEFHVGRNLS